MQNIQTFIPMVHYRLKKHALHIFQVEYKLDLHYSSDWLLFTTGNLNQCQIKHLPKIQQRNNYKIYQGCGSGRIRNVFLGSGSGSVIIIPDIYSSILFTIYLAYLVPNHCPQILKENLIINNSCIFGLEPEAPGSGSGDPIRTGFLKLHCNEDNGV